LHIPGEARGSCTFVTEIGTRLPTYALFLAQTIGSHAFDRLRWLQHGAGIENLPRLSKRQRQCAALAGRGFSNPEIALCLGISLQTVMEYLREAFARLGVGSRTELAIALLRLGDLCFDDVPPRAARG
jgi:LuxR family quorum-sensing system transcriptional regulator CciR